MLFLEHDFLVGAQWFEVTVCFVPSHELQFYSQCAKSSSSTKKRKEIQRTLQTARMAYRTPSASLSGNGSTSFQSASKVPDEEGIQFEIEPAYQRFIDTCPSAKATEREVMNWIKSWFDASGAFITDIGLQLFLNQIKLSGYLLHNVRYKETLFDYLDQDCNKCKDGQVPLYSEEVMKLLVDYIWVARGEKKRTDQENWAGSVLDANKNSGSKDRDVPQVKISEIGSRSPYKEVSLLQRVKRVFSPKVRNIPEY